jgi:hypothetical protein
MPSLASGQTLIAVRSVTQEINRLTALVERQSTMIREIEIRSTTRVAELQKDVEEIRVRYLGRKGLIGRLGKDPEGKFTPTGKKLSYFSVAISNRWKSKDGEAIEKTVMR